MIILSSDYLKRNYPEYYEKIQDYIISFSYNLIFIYSKCEIFYTRNYCKIKKIILSIPLLKGIIDNIYNLKEICDLEYIVNGDIISYYDIQLCNISHINENEICIFSDFNNNNNNNNNRRVNKKIIHSLPICKDYENSNITFMLVEIKIGDKNYKINLRDEKYNYYVVNNIFDKIFFTYYLMNHIQEKLTHEYIYSQKLILKLIDNNVEVKEIDITNNSKYITIRKNDYLINER
jgi:hypothetical protein